MKKLTISIDFDGVLNMAEYPEIGEIDSEKIRIIRKWTDRGHQIIFNSCRPAGELLMCLCGIFTYMPHGYLYYNENTPENIKKYGGDCRKIYADVYIDDHNILQIGKPVDFELYDKIIRRLEHGEV